MAEYEAIVRDIQQGSREKLSELWEAVRPFAARQARRRMTAYREHNSDYALDTEDLIQEGFFALLRAAVDSALAALPEHLRVLITVRYLQGQTFQTMAAAAGVTTQGISDKTHRALKRLRKQDRTGRLAEFARQI